MTVSQETYLLERELREADFNLSLKLLFANQEEVDIASMGREAILIKLRESQKKDRENHYDSLRR